MDIIIWLLINYVSMLLWILIINLIMLSVQFKVTIYYNKVIQGRLSATYQWCDNYTQYKSN
jgi:hypothetical protein